MQELFVPEKFSLGAELQRDLALMTAENINEPDEYGYTLLHRVIKVNGCPEENVAAVIEMLAQYKSLDLNVHSGYEGETPLYMAVFYGRFKVVECLVKAGADVNKQNICVNIEVYHQQERSATREEFARHVYQLRMKMDKVKHCPESVTFDGKTPLLAAYVNKNKTLIRYLSNNGARADIPDRNGFMVQNIESLNSFTSRKSIVRRTSLSVHTPENEKTPWCSCWGLKKNRQRNAIAV